MNVVILRPEELERPLEAIGRVASITQALLPPSDPRVRHIRKVLKKTVKDTIRIGLSSGLLGEGRILHFDEAQGLHLECHFTKEAPALAPLTLIIGLVRPIQAQRMLRELCSLGPQHILLCPTALGETSYLKSHLYGRGQLASLAVDGASQSGNPRLPEIELGASLPAILAKPSLLEAKKEEEGRFVFHPGKQEIQNIEQLREEKKYSSLVLAIGSERGWTTKELQLFEDSAFLQISLGQRLFRTETAAVLAMGFGLSRVGEV